MIAKVKICFLVVSSCFGASCGHGTPLATVSAATYVPLAVQTPGAEKSGTDARSVGDACDEAVICRGDFRVESDTELTALDRCRSISGDLVVQNLSLIHI